MAEKSASSVHPRSLKAASSILKSLSSLVVRKSQSTNPQSGFQSPRSIQKSVSIVNADKAALKDSGKIPKMDLNSSNASEDREKERTISIVDLGSKKTPGSKIRPTKFMRKYPELFRDDVSINPSYTGLRNFPYNVVCRQRFHNDKSKINRQLNEEIKRITMTQTVALDGVRVGRIFTVGFHPKETIVQDFATSKERERLNQLLRER